MNDLVRIVWKDAVIISPKERAGNALSGNRLSLSEMETTGVLYQESDEGFLIKNPVTFNKTKNRKHPEKDPSFFFIPRGMVLLCENIVRQ